MKPRDVKPLQKLAKASASCSKEVRSCHFHRLELKRERERAELLGFFLFAGSSLRRLCECEISRSREGYVQGGV